MKEKFIKSLNQLIYDIDPYNYNDNYGSLEEGLAALKEILYDVRSMEAVLSSITDAMENSNIEFSKHDWLIVSNLKRHISLIKSKY
ncbi:hypothetical protein [uncultured Anaerovibrio sp.]|uniref:hypothetical protein n=1 Tax=uncultured Anaerovibrio sp. TaxID=361586 RepID=UPI0025D02884|nr:hypothetical protein [uncultured Anaerovibrio sp.]